MPISSIFANIIIDTPEKAEMFIDALEKSICDPVWQPTTPIAPLTDAEGIRRLMAKRTDK